MNTIRLFLFPTEWSATLVLFFFALRRMANCQHLWEVLILLGFFLSIFFMVCLASLTYARMDTHVRLWAKLIDVDGNDPTAFSVENFTAAARTYRFHGKNAHPGNGFYTKYGDALTAASYFIGQLPPETHPSASKDKEGYIHCYSVSHPTDEMGNEITEDYLVKVRLRYFDVQEGDTFRQLLDEATELTAKAFPNVMIDADPEVMQYENVAYSMYPGLSDLIIEAAEKEGVKLTPRSERGGTTAAMLAAKGQKGAPCLYSGQQAEHSVYEWTCAEDMYQMVMVARSIIETVANQ